VWDCWALGLIGKGGGLGVITKQRAHWHALIDGVGVMLLGRCS